MKKIARRLDLLEKEVNPVIPNAISAVSRKLLRGQTLSKAEQEIYDKVELTESQRSLIDQVDHLDSIIEEESRKRKSNDESIQDNDPDENRNVDNGNEDNTKRKQYAGNTDPIMHELPDHLKPVDSNCACSY